VTLNHEVFRKDPLTYDIPNDGVSKVGRPDDEKQWAVLRYELESFVCEGEYATGLQRILDSYVRHVGEGDQPAAWVSGFYGSGKSHLIRVLEHLWANTQFPDGASARGLTQVSQGVSDVLRELSTVAARLRVAPWAASGSLDTAQVEQLNAAFLAVVLGAAGLPDKVAPARVALWLQSEGMYDDVVRHIDQAGAQPLAELRRYNVSTRLADAILAAKPGYAESSAAVRSLLKAQFPDEREVSTADTVEMLRDVLLLVGDGKVPPTLVVLDEVQQYINDDADRAMAVQHLVEAVSKGFGGRVLLVATGQQELVGNPTLEKIKDRFSVQVHLHSQDVDVVVRRVLLAKEPARQPGLQTTLDRAQGEIRRQLAGSRLQHTDADDQTLVADYPLLPNRRRLWEDVLRASGRAGQLRSQLRVVHDANAAVGRRDVGTVVGADYLYEYLQDLLNAAGHLLKETQTLIKDQAKNPDDGPLRARILGLVHLISLLPTDGPQDRGVRPTADHIADLLVEDLASDGARLRQRVPELLATLAKEGVLQQRDHEFFTQTEAGREWTQDFERLRSVNITDAVTVGSARDAALREAVTAALPTFVMQSKERRRIAVQFGDVKPQLVDAVPVWVRSGWEVTQHQFEDLARGEGSESPLVFVYLPKVGADDLREALADLTAAQQVLDTRAAPTTDEGRQARSSMQSRRDAAQRRVKDLVAQVVGQATVELAGGGAPDGTAFADQVRNAAERAVARLYPAFAPAAPAGWATVVERLRAGGGPDVLTVIGHQGPAETHEATKTVLTLVGSAGADGNKLEKTLAEPPYGWGGDAIKGAIAALVASQHLTATNGGQPATAKQVATLTRLGQLHVRREAIVIGPVEQIRARALIQALGAQPSTTEPLPDQVRRAVSALATRASTVSGEPPLPSVEVPTAVRALTQGSGNALVLDAFAAEADLKAFAEGLNDLESRRTARERALARARILATAAAGVDAAVPALDRLTAFTESRDLLAPDDAITPIENELADALRQVLNTAQDEYAKALTVAMVELGTTPAWADLDDADRARLVAKVGLHSLPPLDLSDSAAVLDEVRARPVASWRDLRDALPVRVSRALTEALRMTTPQAISVALPSATISSEQELDAYVTQVRGRLVTALAAHGSIVVISA
jgi:phage tail protein X